MKHSVKVVCLLWTGGTGGAERHVYDLVTGLPRERFTATVCFLARAQTYGPLLAQAGVPLYEVGMRNGYDLIGAWRLLRWLQRSNFDLVHDHISPPWARAAIGMGVPTAKIVATEHNAFLLEGSSRWARLWFRVSARFTDVNIAVSDAIRTVLIRDLSIPPDRVEVIPNFVDVSRFDSVTDAEAHDTRRALGIAGDAVILVSIGRLEAQKRFDCLIDMLIPLFRKRPELHLLIIGEGQLKPALLAQIAEAQLQDRILLLGSRLDVPPLLKASDIFVLTSRIESFGIVVLEAMLAGIPVVASRAGSLGEIVQSGKTGILIEETQLAQFPAAVAQLVDDVSQRVQMGQAGRQRALALFERHQVISRIVNVYECVLAPK